VSRALADELVKSHLRCFGRPLLENAPHDAERLANQLFAASTYCWPTGWKRTLVSSIANVAVLSLWGCEWTSLVGMPSRLTAEPSHRQSRVAVLKQALEQESMEGYTGVRVNHRGRRYSNRSGQDLAAETPDGNALRAGRRV